MEKKTPSSVQDDQSDDSQTIAVEQLILDVFQDERKYNRVMKEIILINQLPDEYFEFMVEKMEIGLKIGVIVKPLILGKNGLQNFNKGKAVTFDVFLPQNYPFESPKVFCKTKFSYPSLADGRDLLEDILEKPYVGAILLDKVIQNIPNFLKRMIKQIYDYDFVTNLGDYYIGDEYDLQDFKNLEGIYLVPAKEIISKSKQFERVLMLTDSNLLSFHMNEDLQSGQQEEEEGKDEQLVSTSNTSVGKLVNFYRLNQFQNIEKQQRHKIDVVVITWKKPNDKKQSSQHSEVAFQILEVDDFINQINQRVEQVGQTKLFGAHKKNNVIEENEVTSKQYDSMDIQQIIENITLLENQLCVELSVNTINTLSNLYGKAIEFLSAKGDENFKIFMDRMQDLLSREDIQAILQCEQDNKQSQQEQTLRRKLSSQGDESKKNLYSQSQDNQQGSVFDDIIDPSEENQEQQQKNRQKYNSHGGQDNRNSIVQQRGKAASASSQISSINSKIIDFKNNQQRYSLTETNSQNSAKSQVPNCSCYYEQQVFYDNQDKKRIVKKEYTSHHISQFILQKNITENIHSKNIITPVLCLNQETYSIVSDLGQCTLYDYFVKCKRKTDQQSLLIIMQHLLHAAQTLSSSSQSLILCPQNFSFVVSEQYREYNILLSNIEPLGTDLFINRAYCSDKMIEKMQKGVDSKDIAEEEQQNLVFSVARTIQRLLCANGEEFSKKQIPQFFETRKENNEEYEQFRDILTILEQILVEQSVNSLQQVQEILREKLNLPENSSVLPRFKDPHGYVHNIFQHFIKDTIQKKLEEQMKDEKPSLSVKLNIDNMLILHAFTDSLYPFFVSNFQQTYSKNLEQLLEILDENCSEKDQDVIDFDDQKNESQNNENEKEQGVAASQIVLGFYKLLIDVIRTKGENKQILENVESFFEQNQNLQTKDLEVLDFIQSILFVILNELGFSNHCFKQLQSYENLDIQERKVEQNNEPNKEGDQQEEEEEQKQDEGKSDQDKLSESKLIQIDEILISNLYAKKYYLYTHGGNSNFKKGLEQLHLCFIKRAQIFGENSVNSLSVLSQIANLLNKYHKYKESLQITEKIVSRSTLLNQDNQLALSYPGLLNLQSKIHLNLKNIDQAWSFANSSLEIQKKINPKVSPLLLETYILIGLIYLNYNQQEEGIKVFQKAINLTGQVFKGNHPFKATLFYKMGVNQINMNSLESAVQLFTQSLEIRKKVYGIHHHLVGECLGALGQTYLKAGELQEAQSFFQQSIDMMTEQQKEEGQDILQLYTTLQSMLIQQGKIDFAWESIQNSEPIFDKHQDRHLNTYVSFLERKSICLAQFQQNQEAAKIQLKIVEFYKKKLSHDDQKAMLNYAQKTLNLSLQLEKDPEMLEKAIEYQEESILIIKKFLGLNNVKIIQILRSISNNLMQINKNEEAVEKLVEAIKIMQQNNVVEEEYMKIVRDMANICVQMVQKGQVDEVFNLNETIQNHLLTLFGTDSPIIEFASSIIQASLNQSM